MRWLARSSWMVSALVLLPLAPAAQGDKVTSSGWMSDGPQLPAVTLIDHDGRSVALVDVARDRTLVLSFFFTVCAQICPVQTATLRDLQALLARENSDLAHAPLIISISVNPIADTPEEIRRYASDFDARLGLEDGWLMLTGSVEALGRVWAAFGVSGFVPDDHAPVLWIGRPEVRRWTRISSLAPPTEIRRLLRSAAQ